MLTNPYVWQHKRLKTTVEIPEMLFRQAKQHCSEKGISLRTLLETGLRAALDPPKKDVQFRMKPFGFKGEGQTVQDWTVIRELAYEGRGGVPSAADTKGSQSTPIFWSPRTGRTLPGTNEQPQR